MANPCCIKPIAKIIYVGNIKVGLTGLDSAFQNVNELNVQSEEGIKDELLSQIIKFGNYITKNQEYDYKDALFREYQTFLINLKEKKFNGKQ